MTNGKAKPSGEDGEKGEGSKGEGPSVNVAKYLNSIWLHLSALRCATSRTESSRGDPLGAHLSGSSKTFLSAIKMRQQQQQEQEQQLVESNLTVCTAHKAMSSRDCETCLLLPRRASPCLHLPPQRVLQVAFWRFFLCFSFGFFSLLALSSLSVRSSQFTSFCAFSW